MCSYANAKLRARIRIFVYEQLLLRSPARRGLERARLSGSRKKAMKSVLRRFPTKPVGSDFWTPVESIGLPKPETQPFGSAQGKKPRPTKILKLSRRH